MAHQYKVHWGGNRQTRVYCGLPYTINLTVTEERESVTCDQCRRIMRIELNNPGKPINNRADAATAGNHFASWRT